MLSVNTSAEHISSPNDKSGEIIDASQNFERKQTINHHKNSQENLQRLHENMGEANNSSYDSMEGAPTENKEKQDLLVKVFKDYFPPVALAVASGTHLIAAFAKATKILPSSVENFFDNYSLKASKVANLYNYTAKGSSAIKHGRSWDGLGRLAYWIAPLASLENFFLFSGISSGISMMEQGHIDKVKPADNLIDDFKNNSKAFVDKIKEVFKHGLGKDRIVFTNVFTKEGREREEKFKGTMFISAFGNFLGAALGILSPAKDSVLRKFAAIIRNLGGIGCDIGKFFHADPNNRNSAIAYGIVSTLDIVQTFTPEPLATILSHFSLATNNLANFYYVNTSKARDEQTYQQNPHKQDLQSKEKAPQAIYSLAA